MDNEIENNKYMWMLKMKFSLQLSKMQVGEQEGNS